MKLEDLIEITKNIISDAKKLSSLHTDQGNAPVNYACIFTQSQSEYNDLLKLAHQLGSIAEETRMGPVFKIQTIPTEAGPLQILKIRRPDPKRPERGDVDFTVSDYPTFKDKYLNKPGFNIIERENMEMIELIDPSFNVIAYYSYPTLAEVFNIQLD
jgi:hypothetical protein